MLQSIRDRAQGWIAWAIVILISIPFALWGIQSYLGVGAEPVVASVNGAEITERDFETRYRDVQARYREALGDAYENAGVRDLVLDQMIREELVLQTSFKLGLRASDQELRLLIQTEPAFQENGQFSNDLYTRALRLQGYTPAEHADALRRRVVGTQIERALTTSAFVTNDELAERIRLEQQKRRVSYITIPSDDYIPEDAPTEQAVLDFYQENQELYRVPERVKLQYLLLDADSLGTTAASPTEADLRALYEAEIDRFREQVQRHVRHILIQTDTDGDEASAKSQAEELLKRIRAGEPFEALASEFSDDPVSAAQGGDLGFIQEGAMDPAFDRSVFSLDIGTVSDPVRSRFGYHLIEVLDEKGGLMSFEDAHDELVRLASQRDAEGLYFDWAERLANLVYESPDSLDPAAEELGLELKISDWIDRSGGEGILKNQKVIAAAFSEDVLNERLNSDLIEPQRDLLKAIVLRVVEHEASRFEPLENVRDDVVDRIQRNRATERAKKVADDIVHRLKGDAAAEVSGYAATEPALIRRDAPGLDPAIRELAFTMMRPHDDLASYDSLTLENGDAAVVTVSEVEDGKLDSLTETEREQARILLGRRSGMNDYSALVADLQERADIERKLTSETDDF